MNVHQQKIYNYLLEEIACGDLSRNQRIPTEKELGRLFDTNRMNAHLAVKELERVGILRRNKKQGTFIDRIPSPVTMGELKSLSARRVCVLSHLCPQNMQIHWNKRILDVFEKKLQAKEVEMAFRDISSLNSGDEFRVFIKGLVKDGYRSLVMIGDDFINSVVSEHPEVLFQFHNNVFIFDRGSTLWHAWPYSVVSVNLFREGVIAAEHLLHKNYKKIVFASYDNNNYWQRERERGLRFGLLRGSGGKLRPKPFKMTRGQEGEALKELRKGDRKCAIVAVNDEAAHRILRSAASQALEAGKDFGLMGFDDNPRFRNLNLTTISPPLEKIGAKLAELVVENIDNKQNKEVSAVRIDSELITGKTC